jgi:hypothetical protein
MEDVSNWWRGRLHNYTVHTLPKGWGVVPGHMPSLPPHTDSCWRRRYLDVRYESRSTYNMELIMMDIERQISRYFLRVIKWKIRSQIILPRFSHPLAYVGRALSAFTYIWTAWSLLLLLANVAPIWKRKKGMGGYAEGIIERTESGGWGMWLRQTWRKSVRSWYHLVEQCVVRRRQFYGAGEALCGVVEVLRNVIQHTQHHLGLRVAGCVGCYSEH